MKHNAEHYAQLAAKMSDQIARENAAKHLQKIEDVIESMASRGIIDFNYDFQTYCDAITLNIISSELQKNGFNFELKRRSSEVTSILLSVSSQRQSS